MKYPPTFTLTYNGDDGFGTHDYSLTWDPVDVVAFQIPGVKQMGSAPSDGPFTDLATDRLLPANLPCLIVASSGPYLLDDIDTPEQHIVDYVVSCPLLDEEFANTDLFVRTCGIPVLLPAGAGGVFAGATGAILFPYQDATLRPGFIRFYDGTNTVQNRQLSPRAASIEGIDDASLLGTFANAFDDDGRRVSLVGGLQSGGADGVGRPLYPYRPLQRAVDHGSIIPGYVAP